MVPIRNGLIFSRFGIALWCFACVALSLAGAFAGYHPVYAAPA